MRKRIAFVIVTLFISIAVPCVLGELVVRLFRLAHPISTEYSNFTSLPYLAYGPKPNSHQVGKTATGEFDYDYKHNSFGLRDEEHALHKTRGAFRILGLGDSFTYGVGANYVETYLYRLERNLNARPGRHPNVEVIKAGIPKFFTEPERMLLQGLGKEFQPDLVIVGFIVNDVIDAYFCLDAVTVNKSGFLLTRQAAELGDFCFELYKHSHLCRLIISKYVSWRINRDYRPDWKEVYKKNGFHEADWIKVESEFQKIASTTESIGADLLIINIPQRGPWTEEHNYPQHRLGQWAKARGIAFLDLLPAMKQAQKEQSLYYTKDGHCTPAGYSIVADELAKFIVERRLVP